MQIWKYPLSSDAVQDILMPKGAEILTVQTQGETPCLWAQVDERALLEPRRIRVYGTGHPMQGPVGKYMGTFQIHGGALVFYVYEIPIFPVISN